MMSINEMAALVISVYGVEEMTMPKEKRSKETKHCSAKTARHAEAVAKAAHDHERLKAKKITAQNRSGKMVCPLKDSKSYARAKARVYALEEQEALAEVLVGNTYNDKRREDYYEELAANLAVYNANFEEGQKTYDMLNAFYDYGATRDVVNYLEERHMTEALDAVGKIVEITKMLRPLESVVAESIRTQGAACDQMIEKLKVKIHPYEDMLEDTNELFHLSRIYKILG